MGRRTKTFARKLLLRHGPFLSYEIRGHCMFCGGAYPYHREYCPWADYFAKADDGMARVSERAWNSARVSQDRIDG